MIREKISQGSFYDMLWKTFLPEDHELIRIKREFKFDWLDEELKGYYSTAPDGRPPYPPRTMFLMLFLEFYENLSDHKISERTKYNALYRYFVGLALEDDVPDYSSLSVFRKRIGEEGFRRVFNRSVLAKELEKLKELLALARGKFDYVPEIQAGADWVEDLLLNSEESIGSLTDPDARFGYKKKDEPFHGYKAHTVTNESEIVTSVETIPGNVHEGGGLPRLLKEEEKRDLPGDIVLADGLYASGNNREAIRSEELRMQEVIPAQDKAAQADKFIYDPRTDSLICPNGNTAIAPSPHNDGKLFYFSKRDCMICPLQSQCPSFSKREGRARVFLSVDRQLRASSPLSPEAQKALFRFRTIVERIYGKAKHWHGFGRARYRGRWRVAIQSFMTFLVLNAKKALRIKEGLVPLKPPGLAALGYGC